MTMDLRHLERDTKKAVRTFWTNREGARKKQELSGKLDHGERAGVTAGNNMNGFVDLITRIVRYNGLESADVCQQRRLLTLPGYFRPTKQWDLLVLYRSELIAAIELKSQVGPSFGNNFNNRAEEAIGTASDLWVAYREGAFGAQPQPFAGWLMLVEDAPASRSAVQCSTAHFPVFSEFQGASYIDRYELLCKRLIQEKLYTAASIIASPRSASKSGSYNEASALTGITAFAAALGAHVVAAKARLG